MRKDFKNVNELYKLKAISEPFVSKDSKWLVYTQTEIRKTADCYLTKICLTELFKKKTEVVIDNGFINKKPCLKNNQVWYLSNQMGKFQVFSFDFATKAQQQWTFATSDVDYFAVLEDELLFRTTLNKNFADQVFSWNEIEIKEKEKYYYEASELGYLVNGAGFVDTQQRQFLCSQSLKNGKIKVLSSQATGYDLRTVAAISQDEQFFVYEDHLHPDDEYNQDSGVFLFDRKKEEKRWLTHTCSEGIFGEASLSPDQKMVAMIGNPLRYETKNQLGLYCYDIKEDRLFSVLDKDSNFADVSVTDFPQNISNPQLQWDADSKSVYVQVSEFGRVHLYQVDIETGKYQTVEPASYSVKEFVSCPTGGVIASLTRHDQPLKFAHYQAGKWSEVATAVSDYYQNFTYANYQELCYEADDGGVIHGFLVEPTAFDKGQKYPLIVNIHGGPYTMHADVFFHEAQYLAAHGYGVLLLNPRGSHGYGQEHVSGVYQRYGKEDYTDVLTATKKTAAKYHWIDRDNLFVTGGSYGGFMVNWIVTHSSLFKAAISQRSMTNFVSLVGDSDIGYFFFKDELGLELTEFEKLWQASPIAYAKEVKTPLLLMQSAEDFRCPLEQAQQFFTHLKYLGKEVELLIFTDSNHELSRSGRPSNRVKRLASMLAWFERFKEE